MIDRDIVASIADFIDDAVFFERTAHPILSLASEIRRDENGDILIDVLESGTKDAPLEILTVRVSVTVDCSATNH